MFRPKRLLLALAGALALGVGMSAAAADKALLIGVGKYQMESANLPGIDLDVGMMKDVAESLGFAPGNIKVLMDQEATLANVKSTMSGWLNSGTSPSDRILIYYSGHGAPIPDENGDERDGVDETLTMHDTAIIKRNGRTTLSGVLVDDDFNILLNGMRSRNVLVLLDACHSGTATKSLSLGTRSLGVGEGVAKYFEYKDMPSGGGGSFSVGGATRDFKVERKQSSAGGGGSAFVAISAAGDDEKSIATKHGSVFTLGIKEAVMASKSAGDRSLTPRHMWKVASNFVTTNLPADRVFHPQLNGSEALMDQPVSMPPTADGRGPVWRKVEALADGSGGVRILTDKQSFVDGDKMVLRVQVPEAGYLNIINVGPDDVPTVLFPNQFHQDNKVAAGTVTLPTDKMDFDLVAREPYGASLVVAVVSKKPLNLFQNADAKRNDKGIVVDDFGQLSEEGLATTRSFKVEARNDKEYRAGKLENRICRSASSCN